MEFSVHAERLFDLLRWNGLGASREALAALTPESWKELCDLGDRLQVAPLLYTRLREHGLLDLPPTAVVSQLGAIHHATALRNLALYHVLAKIAATAEALSIPLVALKGIALAAPVYGNVALRPMGDIDLLAPKSQVGALYDALIATGYSPFQHDNLGAGAPLHLPRLQGNGGQPLVELHVRLASPDSSFAFLVDEIWGRLEPIELPGCRLLGLGAEDLLLYLCVHATYQHELLGVGVKPLCDLAQLLTVRGTSLRWPELLERAERWRCGRGLALMLRLAHDLVGAPVPDAILRSSGASGLPEPLLVAAQAHLFLSYEDGRALPRQLAEMVVRQSPWARVDTMRRRIFVSREALAHQFQVSPQDLWLPLYYVARFGRLLRHQAVTALALAGGDKEMRQRAEHRASIGHWLAQG